MDQFHFRGFTPDEKTEAKAGRVYQAILDASPEDAKLSAVLEWDGERYHCSVEVGSKVWPAAASVAHRFPGIALDRAEIALQKKLAKWHGFFNIRTPPSKPLSV